MPASTPLDPAALASHAGWLRALARGLVHDDALADDLVQDTWVAALRHPPDADRPLRPWLVHVLRNAARFRWRGEARRAAREHAAMVSGEAAAPSSEALLERLQAQRALARLVAELDEPFRAAVLACYAEGATPSELARQLGVPAGTVRWRLQEARSRLRQALLDEHDGDRRPALAVLAPLVTAAPRRPTWVVPAAALLALALIVAMIAVVVRTRDPARPAIAPATSGPAVRASALSPSTIPVEDRVMALAAGASPGWLAQEGVAARRVAGHVRRDGAPAPGVTVRLTSALSRAGLAAVREVITDAAGHFDLGPHVAHTVTVSAGEPGRLAAIVHVELRDAGVASDRLALDLLPCAAGYHGRVIDAAGGGIAGAELLREDAIGTTADRDGRYALCLPPTAAMPDELRVVVRADGYGSIAVDAAPAGDTARDFVLVPEAIVTGRAVTAAGAPVIDARITIEPERGLEPTSEAPAARFAVTDRDGRFRVDGVSVGRFRVTVAARAGAAAPVSLTVAAGDTREVALVVAMAGVVRGRVVRAGAPVPGAVLRVLEGDGADAVTQADGSFVLDRAPVGAIRLGVAAHRLVAASGAARLEGSGGGAVVDVTAGVDATVELTVADLGALFGRVEHLGAGVAYARVTCGGVGYASTTADRKGQYRLDGLWPGDYLCSADDGRLIAYLDQQKVTLADGEQRALDLALQGAEIRGQVVDGGGVGVPGVHVLLDGPAHDRGRCVTAADGGFRCAALRGGGRYTPAVYAGPDGAVAFPWHGAPPAAIEVADAETAIDRVVLAIDPRRATLVGTVVDADGAPVADARVRVRAAVRGRDPWRFAAPPVGVTAADGAFAIADLAPGAYALEVQSADGLRQAREPVETGRGPVVLVLAPATCDRAVAVVTAVPVDAARPAAPIVWDDRIELVGWSVPATATRGEVVEITAYFRVRAPLERAWKVFLHIDGPDWRVNGDHAPAGGRCPTSTWQAGDLVVDRFAVTIHPDAPDGRFVVWVGFFAGWAPDWVNLDVSTAPAAARDRHRIRLAELVVR